MHFYMFLSQFWVLFNAYHGHVISEVHIMIAFQIRKWIRQPDHVDIVVHDIIPKFQNVQ